MITINTFEEMTLFYVKETDTYVFNGDVEFTFDLQVDSNIEAWNVKARNIEAWNVKAMDVKAKDINAKDMRAWNIEAQNIKAWDIEALDIIAWNIEAKDINAIDVKITGDIKGKDIKARNIEAGNIIYFAVCFAYWNIICKSIKGERENHKHFVLDGEIIFEPKEEEKTTNILC